MKCIIKYALYTIFLFASLVISSCSKDDSNPVEATVVVKISGTLDSYNGVTVRQTILKADLLFDGNVIASANFQSGTDTALLDGTVNSAKKRNSQYFFQNN
ncbi:MAG: hypothetical protein WC879_02690 [Melioribacteraceae bacterium]